MSQNPQTDEVAGLYFSEIAFFARFAGHKHIRNAALRKILRVPSS